MQRTRKPDAMDSIESATAIDVVDIDLPPEES
jgi:hypothetical protein